MSANAIRLVPLSQGGLLIQPPDGMAFPSILSDIMVIVISITPRNPETGDFVEFFADVGPEGSGIQLVWDFGDGETSTEQRVLHSYATPSIYNISLTVTTGNFQGTYYDNLTVIPPSLIITSVTATPEDGVVPHTTTLTSQVVGGSPPFAYFWEFGDGSTSNQVEPLKIYQTVGTYTVTLTVTDSFGVQAVSVQTNLITVSAADPLSADFTGTPTTVEEGNTVFFDSTVTGGTPPYSYSWTFGDGGVSSLADPSYIYAASGTYTVAVVVTDSATPTPAEVTVTKTNYITVTEPEPPPAGDFVNYNIESDAELEAVIIGTNPDPDHGPHIDEPFHPKSWWNNPTIQQIQPGDWDDPDTWDLGRVPIAGDVVLVEKLVFDPTVNTRLTSQLILINDGELEIDYSSDATKLAEIVFPNIAINTSNSGAVDYDPWQWGNGLLSTHGTLTMLGAVKTPWANLAAEPLAGNTTLTLGTSPVGWRAGDRLILPDTKQWNDTTAPSGNQYVEEWEEVIVASVVDNVVTLTTPVVYNHYGIRDYQGNIIDYTEVANLTRNVLIRSADRTGTRGHTAYHGRTAVDIQYVEYRDMGRTLNSVLSNTTPTNYTLPVTKVGSNQIGRYVAHFHHCWGPENLPIDVPQFNFIGNSTWNQSQANSVLPKWGPTLHNSSWGLMENNVVYRVSGAGIVSEDGTEYENLIQSNFVMRVPYENHNEGARGNQDVGTTGPGIWQRGTLNRLVNNVVRNCGRGMVSAPYLQLAPTARIPAFKGANPFVDYTTITMQQKGFLEWRGNKIGCAMARGVELWRVGSQGFAPTPGFESSLIEDQVIQHVHQYGFYNYMTAGLTWDNLQVQGNFTLLRAGRSNFMAMFFSDYVATDFVVQNSNIQGCAFGFHVGPLGNSQTYSNVTMRCNTGFRIFVLWAAGHTADEILEREINIDNCVFTADGNGPASVQVALLMVGSPIPGGADATNLIVNNVINVTDFQGVPGDDFRVYFNEQAGSAVLTATRPMAPPNTHKTRILGASGGVLGTVSDTTPSTTNFDGSSGFSDVDDFYNGWSCIFLNGPSGNTGPNSPRTVTDYIGSSRTFIFSTGFSATPVNGNTIFLDPLITNSTALSEQGVCWGNAIMPAEAITKANVSGGKVVPV